jgi:hypothetical protein
MAYSLKQELDIPQIELSLESQVFLAFKHRTHNRRKLLQKLLRAGVNETDQLSDMKKFISGLNYRNGAKAN